MRILLGVILSLIVSKELLAQSNQPVWTADFVKAKPGKVDSAATAYNMNWGEAREYAKKLRFISSYRLLKVSTILNTTQGNSSKPFDIILLTEYPNERAYQNREKNFQVIFDKYQPDWNLFNGKKPADFATIEFDMLFKTLPAFILTK